MSDQGDGLGPLDDLIDQMRSRLLPGGPEVDYAALYAYIDRDLPDAERAEVERRVARWASWHDAYWTTQADLAAFEADGRPGGSQGFGGPKERMLDWEEVEPLPWPSEPELRACLVAVARATAESPDGRVHLGDVYRRVKGHPALPFDFLVEDWLERGVSGGWLTAEASSSAGSAHEGGVLRGDDGGELLYGLATDPETLIARIVRGMSPGERAIKDRRDEMIGFARDIGVREEVVRELEEWIARRDPVEGDKYGVGTGQEALAAESGHRTTGPELDITGTASKSVGARELPADHGRGEPADLTRELCNDLLLRARQRPQAPMLSEEQRACVWSLRGGPLSMGELAKQVGLHREARGKARISPPKLTEFLVTPTVFERTEVAGGRSKVLGGPAGTAGWRLVLSPGEVFLGTCLPLFEKAVSDPQARHDLAAYALDLGVPDEWVRAIRAGPA